jgi:hypothetical protein
MENLESFVIVGTLGTFFYYSSNLLAYKVAWALTLLCKTQVDKEKSLG